MTLPANFGLVYVRGQFIDLSGAPMKGAVTFAPNFGSVLLDMDPRVIIGKRTFTANLDNTGKFSLALPATDDPDILPVGWTYTVTEPTGRVYNIALPIDAAVLNSPGDPLHGQPVVDLISVVPAPAPSTGTVQLLTFGGTTITVDGEQVSTYDIDTTPVGWQDIEGLQSAAPPNANTSLWQTGRVENTTRIAPSGGPSAGSGTLWVAYFYAPRPATISSVGFYTAGTGTAGGTLARCALFTCDASDNLTLVARTASDPTLGASPFAAAARTFSTAGGYPSAYTVQAGFRYAIGVLAVATTPPTLAAIDAVLFDEPPVLCRRITGQADIAASYTAAAMTPHYQVPYVFGRP